MPTPLSVPQIIAIIKGINFYSTPKRWYGVRGSDLLNPNGCDLTASGVPNPVYPYIPGTANPPSTIFVYAKSTDMIQNSAGLSVKVIYNGGDITQNSLTSVVEEGLHKTGRLIQKKIK